MFIAKSPGRTNLLHVSCVCTVLCVELARTWYLVFLLALHFTLTAGRHTPGINPVGPLLPCDNSEDKLDQAEWYDHQCFAAWDHNNFNHVLGTLKLNVLSQYCPALQVMCCAYDVSLKNMTLLLLSMDLTCSLCLFRVYLPSKIKA